MGVTIKVDWDDLDQLARDLKGLPERISKEVQKAQEEDLKDVAKVLANYPHNCPAPTTSGPATWAGVGPASGQR
jgi:hypothetical protein